MTGRDPAARAHVLEELSDDDDPLIAQLASSLSAAAAIESADVTGAGFREAREMISALADQRADEGPGRLIAALNSIDERLAGAGVVSPPWAACLAPLAAERAAHAAREHWDQGRAMDQAERSPVFRTEEKTVFACPVSPLGEEGLSRFVERVLAEVLRHRTKRVVLVFQGLDGDEAGSPAWDSLARDLETQLVRLERR